MPMYILLYVAVQVLEAIPLNCTSSVLRLFVMPTSSLIVLLTFGIHYPMTFSPHALLQCSNVNCTRCVFISLIIVYCYHLHIFPYSSFSFYRAMHFSAKRGIAIACRLSVCLSVCNVGEL